MSGGTDSSVAALLLQDAGYEVTGITFRFYEKDNHTEYLDDARELCERLHIPHITYDAREVFQQHIISYFIDEYMAGRTPVPCTLCNNYLKWPLLQEVADARGIWHFATGHYVQKTQIGDYWHIMAGKRPVFLLMGAHTACVTAHALAHGHTDQNKSKGDCGRERFSESRS